MIITLQQLDEEPVNYDYIGSQKFANFIWQAKFADA
jgi:hypothetical protein